MPDRSEPSLAPCPYCQGSHPDKVLVCPVKGGILPLEGRLLAGKFRFLSSLGEGGMSTVWRAENVLVRKMVAIKIMRPQFAQNPATVTRFRNEATSAGRIGNAHICDIIDLGEDDIGLYIVMEMLLGRSFAELLEDQGRIEPGLAVLILRQALTGLAAAHDAGIVHRDLKPDNVFLHEPVPGRLLVKLMDFGISKFTQDAVIGEKTAMGVIMGTPEYMSPEQAEGAASVDARGDIWAIGLMLYHAIGGTNPFRAPTLAATLTALLSRNPSALYGTVPGVSEGLSRVIMRCLEKRPSARFADARSLFEALAPHDMAPGGAATLAYTPVVDAPTGGSPTPPPKLVSAGSTAAVTPAPTVPTPPQTQPTAEPTAEPTAPTLASPAASDSATPGGTWSGELHATRGDDGWEMRGGVATDEDRRPGRSRGRGAMWLVIAGLVVGGAGLGYAVLGGDQTDNTDEAGDLPVAADATPEATSKPAEDPADAVDNQKPEDGKPGDKDGSTGADPAEGTKPQEDPGTTPGEDKDPGKKDPGKKDPGKKDPGTKKPKVDKSKVASKGKLYALKRSSTPSIFFKAQSSCRRLKATKAAGLGKWRLATAKEVLSFRGVSGIAKTLYWSSTARGASGVTVNLMSGKQASASKKKKKARPFCVAPKKQ